MRILHIVAVTALLCAGTQANFFDDLKGALSSVGNAIANAAGTVVDAAKPVAEVALNGLKDHAGEIATTAATTAAQALLTSLIGKRDVNVMALPEVQSTISQMQKTINSEINTIKGFVHKTYDNYVQVANTIMETPFDVLSHKIDQITESHNLVTKAAWTGMIHTLTADLNKLAGHKIPDTIVNEMSTKLMDLYQPTQTFLHQLATQVGESVKQAAAKVEAQMQSKVHEIEQSGKNMIDQGLTANYW